MKRSFLKELGLETDVIDKVMTEYGKNVEKYKSENADLLLEIKELKSNTVDTDKAIKEALEKQKEEHQTQLDKELEKHKKELEKYSEFEQIKTELETLKRESNERILNDNLEEYFKSNKINFTNSYAKKEITNKIKEKNLEFKDGKFLGLDEFMKELKENEKEAFINADLSRFNNGYTPSAGGSTKPLEDTQKMINEILGIK